MSERELLCSGLRVSLGQLQSAQKSGNIKLERLWQSMVSQITVGLDKINEGETEQNGK